MASLSRALLLALLLPALAAAQEAAPSGVQTGTPLPPLSGVDLQGNPVSLADHLGRATLVLSFWSIHCGDCIRELDDLRSIRRDFPPGEVTVVAVNTDSGLPVARIEGFVRRYEAARGRLDVVHLLDRNAAILDSLGIRYIPVLVVADRAGRVTSVLTGYSPEDRGRVAQAMAEGRVALGAWSEGLRGRLRTLLRGSGAGGQPVEWGSFRVEAGMALFGLYGSRGWLADAAGRRDRSAEAGRVEGVVADRLKVALLREALASVGVRLPAPDTEPFRPRGIDVPESPLQTHSRWKRLYEELRFDELYREEEATGTWVGDEYWAALVGDVDLGKLRATLAALGFPGEPARIRLETVSDFDFKPRSLLKSFQASSPRLQGIEGEHLLFYGDAERLADELRAVPGLPFKVYVEVVTPELVRIEVF